MKQLNRKLFITLVLCIQIMFFYRVSIGRTNDMIDEDTEKIINEYISDYNNKDYDKLWNFSTSLVKQNITKEEFISRIDILFLTYGKILNFKIENPNVVKKPDTEDEESFYRSYPLSCRILNYNALFEKAKEATMEIVLMKEKEGWRINKFSFAKRSKEKPTLLYRWE